MVPPELLARLARCVNVSRWFRYPAHDSERHYRDFLTDADLDVIVSLGVTCVRLAVDPRYLHLHYLDEAVARLTGRGLVVILDYHDESRAIETGPAAVDALVRTWSALAGHLARTTPPDRLVLEVFNEPVFDGNAGAWFPIRARLVETIRAAAPLHTIVAGGPHWSSLDGLLATPPVDDDNVLYTFHFYEPYQFTHQGAPWASDPPRGLSNVPYPTRLAANDRWDASRIDRRIALAAWWAAEHRVPVWAGEFGAYPAVAPRQDRLRWLYDVRTAFERHGIGWAVWSYDESLGLDRRMDAEGRVTIDWDSARALGLRTPEGVT